jgi:hypothetical protein
VHGAVAGSPLAAHVAHVDERTRAALVADVHAALQSFIDTDGVAFPMESHVTLAVAAP